MRTSERSLFKRCPWAWWQAYREGMKPKRVANALWFGELVHVSLAAWYCGPHIIRGPHPAETFQALATDELRMFKTADATEEEMAKYTDLRDLGIVMLEGYTKRYGRDEQWSVISPEKTFEMNIPFPDWWGEDVRKILARYVGTYDLVFRDLATGWIWLGEHKTAATIRKDHLSLDIQAGGYWATAERSLKAEGLIRSDDRLHGITYNFLRKGLPDERPLDKDGYATNKPTKTHYLAALEGIQGRSGPVTEKTKLEEMEEIAEANGLTVLGARSKSQPARLFERVPVIRTRGERKSQLIHIQNDAALMEQARRGEIPITKTPHWSCARFCDFFDICRLDEAGGNWKELREVAFYREDPYAVHHKSTEDFATFEF